MEKDIPFVSGRVSAESASETRIQADGLYGVRGEGNPEIEKWDRERKPANRVHFKQVARMSQL